MLTDFPEFARKGRFDEIFWVDVPDEQARQAIFDIYLRDRQKDGYLKLTAGGVNQLREAESIAASPDEKAGDGLGQFCWLLSQPEISGNMTGAEIEYAVTEALYQAYQLDQPAQAKDKFALQVVLDAVKAAKEKCLYGPNAPQDTHISDLRQIADRSGWIWVGQRKQP